MIFSGEILELNEKRPRSVDVSRSDIEKIVAAAIPEARIARVEGPETWVMQLYRITLEDGRTLVLKIAAMPEWSDASSIKNQRRATEILRSLGLPQPLVLGSSADGDICSFPYLLSEAQRGRRLYSFLDTAGPESARAAYRAIGGLYAKIHGIRSEWAGLWNGGPEAPRYPLHPADFYLGAELEKGSAPYLVEGGFIDEGLRLRIIDAWKSNLDYLRKRDSAMIHASPFPWTIRVEDKEGRPALSGLSALGDVMSWDPMLDVAHILHPPYLDLDPACAEAFMEGYGLPFDEDALRLYRVLGRICAMAGVYFAPVRREAALAWNARAASELRGLVDSL